jgi:hypothetical protein
VEARGNIGGVPGGLYGPGNLTSTDTDLHAHWGRITGQAAGTNRYSHEQIDEGDTAGGFAATLAASFGCVGTSAVEGYPAYELGGRTDVPTGAIVRLVPSGDLTYLTFKYDSGAAAVTSWKHVVRVATTANGTDATAFENGDTVDGVVLATGDRILRKNQTTGGENGIFVVNASGAPTRATDADTGAELLGAVVAVLEGTVNKDTIWMCTTDATITIGTTATQWVRVYPPAEVDLTYDRLTLASTYTITATGAYELVTGLTLTLPAAGDYLVSGLVKGSMEANLTDTPYFIEATMYDNTALAAIPGTNCVVVHAVQHSEAITTHRWQGSGSFSVPITVTSGRTIDLYAQATGFTPPHMTIDPGTTVSWVKIGTG